MIFMFVCKRQIKARGKRRKNKNAKLFFSKYTKGLSKNKSNKKHRMSNPENE